MISLPSVTLCAVSSVRIDETVHALKQSMRNITFGNVLLLTDKPVSDSTITVIPIEPLDYDGYSKFIMYRLKDFITTDYVLIVQHDGYVLHPQSWDPIFLQYDYIGAPWPKGMHHTVDGTEVRVGNGGFSLRSKRMLNMPTQLNLPFIDNNTGHYHEDGVLCNYHRKALEAAGIQFAPVEIAARFSHEMDCKESVRKPFGFHGSKIVLPPALWPIKKLFRALKIRL
jgi:hypothetical protein